MVEALAEGEEEEDEKGEAETAGRGDGARERVAGSPPRPFVPSPSPRVAPPLSSSSSGLSKLAYFVLAPAGSSARQRIEHTFKVRGRYPITGFRIATKFPAGFFKKWRRIDATGEILVYPKPQPLDDFYHALPMLAGQIESHGRGSGDDLYAIRRYHPSDHMRYIDWKATARRGKVITRQYEAERRQQVLLVLDTGRLMTADVAAGVARLDFAVQAALELAYAAAQHDDNVGIMTFADGVQHFVAPERGRTGVRRVMDVLAEVQPKLVEPDYPGAFRYLAARNRKRALTVLFTDVIDRFASDALVANVATLRPRHLPLAVTLRNPELDAAAMQRPATPRDAYRKAAAEELLHAREEALGHMRRAGVLVIDVTPERAAQAVVAKYLDLKRRGTL